MSISISNYPVHLQDGFKPNRECLKSQGSQSEYQKVFHRDSLEVSQLSKNREILMDKIKHTVVQSAASLSDMRAGILKEIREEKGQYGYSDVVNACGLSQGNIPEMPTEEMEELEDSFYQAKDAYMKLYRENRRAERPLVLQSYMFGNSQMYQILNRLGNLQERVV